MDVEGSPIAIHVHTADVQDRDGAPDVILDMLEVAPTVAKLFADGGYQGPKLRAALQELGVSDLVQIVEKAKGCQRVHRRLPQVGGRTYIRLDGPVPPLGQGL